VPGLRRGAAPAVWGEAGRGDLSLCLQLVPGVRAVEGGGGDSVGGE